MISLLPPLRRMSLLTGVLLVTLNALPAPAAARVFVGVGIGVPLFGYPPPVYYPPPPVYYAPPPAYYPPPPVVYTPAPAYMPAPQTAGQSCYAQGYVCPMERPIATGAACYCPGNHGQRVLGRTN